MKVIAIVSPGKYICEVNHNELEKYLNLYYDKLAKLKVGEEIDLSEGYDFKNDTVQALRKTQEFIDANKKVIDAIFNGIKIAGKE